MKKTEIIYTRVNKKNAQYIRDLKIKSKMTRATCLDELFNYMRNNISTKDLTRQIAKRRDEIQEAV